MSEHDNPRAIATIRIGACEIVYEEVVLHRNEGLGRIGKVDLLIDIRARETR